MASRTAISHSNKKLKENEKNACFFRKSCYNDNVR